MIVIRRKDGTYKAAFNRKTGEQVRIDKYGNEIK
jgi:hypothetical protein